MLQRLFTVEDANRTLDRIRPLLKELIRARHQMGALLRDMHRIHREVHSEGGQAGPDLRERLEKGLSRLAYLDTRIKHLVAEIQGHGAVVKDLDMGVVDFPAVIDRHAAYLCYVLGEDEVCHWHNVEEGFGGRRPLQAQKNL